MKRCLVPLLFAAAALAACTHYRFAYCHVDLEETAGLVVVERTKGPEHTAGEHGPPRMTEVPLRAALTRDRYRIEFETPISTTPQLSLRVFAPGDGLQSSPLRVEGLHVGRAHPRTTLESGVLLYYFAVEEALGAPLDIEVRAANGALLGHERLTYRIQQLGVVSGTEWL